MTLPDHLRGDGPCADCGTRDNIVWFTENVLWNDVVRSEPDYVEPILCLPCFVIRADRRGLIVTGWRVLPEWSWHIRPGSPHDVAAALAGTEGEE